MGLFSDDCTQCGNKVKKAARFCNSCGAGAPGGWVKCPGCNKWAGNDSKFCSSCNYSLRPEERELITNDTLRRSSEFFLQRIDLDNIKSRIKDQFIIEFGTMAYAVKNQREVLTLGSGKTPAQSFWQKLFNFGKKDDLTFYIIDAGEIICPIRISGFQSLDGHNFDLYTEAVIKAEPEMAEKMLTNLVKAQRSLTIEEISEQAQKAVRDIALILLRENNLVDLLFDPQKRLAFEDSFNNALYDAMDNMGFTIDRIATPYFDGTSVRKLQNRHQDECQKVDEVRYKTRMRQLVNSDQMDKMTSEKEVEELAQQIASELNISSEKQKINLDLLKQVHRHEIEGKEADFRFSQEAKQQEHDLAIALKKLKSDTNEAEEWLKVREKKNSLKRDDEFAKLKEYSKYDLTTLIAALPKEQSQQLVAMHQATQKAGIPDVVFMNQLMQAYPGGASAIANDPAAMQKIIDQFKSN